MLNLDTHIVVEFYLTRLSDDIAQVMAGESLGISEIVHWELFSLVRLGRIRLDLDDPEFNRFLSRLHRWPVSVHVCRQLRRLDFRSDPADEIIAATSLAMDAPLVTRDARLLASKVVPLALT